VELKLGERCGQRKKIKKCKTAEEVEGFFIPFLVERIPEEDKNLYV
jgi:hypothetical protein